MKKLLAILFAVSICSSFCACGSTNNVQTTQKETTVVKATEAETEAETEAPTDPAPQFNTIETGDKIVLDFVEIKIGDVDHAKEMKEEYITYQPSNEDNEFFWLSSEFTNTMGETTDLYSGLMAQVVFDDKYTYEADFRCFDGSDMDPLVENEVYIYAEVPPAILDKYKTVKVQLGINNNFEDFDYMSHDEEKVEYYDNLYQYEAKK